MDDSKVSKDNKRNTKDMWRYFIYPLLVGLILLLTKIHFDRTKVPEEAVYPKTAPLPPLGRPAPPQINKEQSYQAAVFLQSLGNARKGLEHGNYAEACRNFNDAYERLPENYKSRINKDLIKEATLDYSNNRFYESARKYADAFQQIQIQRN